MFRFGFSRSAWPNWLSEAPNRLGLTATLRSRVSIYFRRPRVRRATYSIESTLSPSACRTLAPHGSLGSMESSRDAWAPAMWWVIYTKVIVIGTYVVETERENGMEHCGPCCAQSDVEPRNHELHESTDGRTESAK